MQFLKQFIGKIEELLAEVDLLSYKQSPIPIVFYLDLSILAGEYYSTQPYSAYYTELKKELNKFDQLLDNYDKKIKFHQAIDSLDKELEAKKAEVAPTSILIVKPDPADKPKISKAKEQLDILRKVQKLYLKLIGKAERDFEEYGRIMDLYNVHEIFDLDLNEELYRHQYVEVRDSEEFEFDVFQINVKLAEIDINLDCEEDTILKLNAYKNFLERQQMLSNEFTNLILRILLDKTKFLLYKVYLRKFKLADNNSAEQEFYSAQTKELKKDLLFYSSFIEKSDKHYINRGSELPRELKIKLESVSSNLTLAELHYVSKHCRLKQSIDGIENVINREASIKKIDYAKFTFDEFAKASATNLLINTKLRIDLEQEVKDNFKNAIKLLQERNKGAFNRKYLYLPNTDPASVNDYKDYYPYTKLFNFFEQLYDYLIEEPVKLLPDDKAIKLKEEGKDIKEDIEKLFGKNGAFDILEDCIDQLIQRFNHSFRFFSHKKYKPIYLTYNECKYTIEKEIAKKIVTNSEIDKFNIELFVESSYILPDDYQRIREEWKGVKVRMKEKLRTLKNAFEIEYQLRFYERSFRKEIENKEFKLVQALAMFIAIATLVLGSMKATENRTVLESMAIIMALGITLMIFNYFIYWFIRVDKRFSNREIIFIVILLLGIGTTYSLSTCNGNNKMQGLKTREDSLNMHQNLSKSLNLGKDDETSAESSNPKGPTVASPTIIINNPKSKKPTFDKLKNDSTKANL